MGTPNNKAMFLFIVLLLVATILTAQNTEEISIPLSNPASPGKLVVRLTMGSIHVKGYDGNEILVNATIRQKKRKEITKNGMRKVNANSMEFSVEEINNTVYIRKGANGPIVDFEIKVPRKFSLKLNAVNNGNILVENVDGEFEVSNTNGKIDMVNISGSVIADALNKNITINFIKVSDNSTMAFSSLNGNLDISFPKNLKATIKAKTDNGGVYTDFDMKVENNTPKINRTKSSGVYKVKVEKWVRGLINGGGGSEMTFKTLNGNIYIRENKTL